ncbi:hypothetical protein D9M68_847220 [compost metagenome]
MQVYRFFRIEDHFLFRLYAQQVELQCTKPDHFIQLNQLFGLKTFCLTGSLCLFLCQAYHFSNQVISIHDCTLTAFHFTGRQFNHTVAEVINTVCRRQAQLLADQLQYLKVVILLITYYIYAFVNSVFFLFFYCQANVLCDINGGPVFSSYQFFI